MRKIKRIAVTSIIGILFSLLPSQVPEAFAGVADCISISTPTASLSSTTLTISGSGTVNCTAAQLGSGGNPVISVVGEGYSAQCSGFYKISVGAYNSFTCTIPIGGFSGSTRYGATSTQIKFWFSWDFSTKFIYVSHQPIPKRVSTTPVPTQAPTPIPDPTKIVVPSPTPIPEPVLTQIPSSALVQNCVLGHFHESECYPSPNWHYEICLGSPNGELQNKINGKWVKIKKITGRKNIQSCEDQSANFLFSLDGKTESNKNMRLHLYATTRYLQSYIYFKITNKSL